MTLLIHRLALKIKQKAHPLTNTKPSRNERAEVCLCYIFTYVCLTTQVKQLSGKHLLLHFGVEILLTVQPSLACHQPHEVSDSPNPVDFLCRLQHPAIQWKLVVSVLHKQFRKRHIKQYFKVVFFFQLQSNKTKPYKAVSTSMNWSDEHHKVKRPQAVNFQLFTNLPSLPYWRNQEKFEHYGKNLFKPPRSVTRTTTPLLKLIFYGKSSISYKILYPKVLTQLA